MGVAGGYLLGRTKKLRLALALGGVLAGRRLAIQGQGLLGQGSKLLESNPQLKELQNQVTGHLFEVAREAALVTAASRIEALTKSLQARQEGGAGEAGAAVGGVTGALGLDDKGEARSKEEQPQDRGGEQESDEEETGEEERGGQPRGRGAEGGEPEGGEPEGGEEETAEEEPDEQPRARADKRGAQKPAEEESDEREQSRQRDRLRGRLRRRRPEGARGSGGSRRSAVSEDEATPRDVAKKVSAGKAGTRPAEKGR